MYSPASPKILYRSPRFFRLAFLQLHHQQQNGVFCDVILQAEGEAVPAHCCILSACSPFFTERLERERSAQGQKVVLELGGLKIRTLRKLVDFLYTSELEVSQEEAQDVLSAARQLRVSQLESLQLEGGKLVKASQGGRLNRECLQLPAAAPVSARMVVPNLRPQTPLPTTWTPCPLGAGRLNSLGKEEGSQGKTNQGKAENLSGTLLLKRKARACPTPQEKSSLPSSHSQGPEKNKNDPAVGPTALSRPSLYPSVHERLSPRKFRLNRSMVSPDIYTLNPYSMLGRPSSVPVALGRRLWRQKSINKEAPEDKQKLGRVSPVQSTPSPCGLGKTSGSKKRIPEDRAPNSSSAEEGQVGRVKLRKIVKETSWEMVQEPPLKISQGSLQIPEPGGDLAEPQSSSGRPELVRKGPVLDRDCKEPYAFDTTLLRQPCEAEEYRITSAAATSELEVILDIMSCDSDTESPVVSLQSPEAEDCRTPSDRLKETGKYWIEEEEWCLPDLELQPRELTGLEKEPVDENEKPTEPLSSLVMPSEMNEGEVLSVAGSWIPDLEITSYQTLDGQGDKLLYIDSLNTPQRSYEDLSPPCSNWADTGLEVSLTTDGALYPATEADKEVFGNSGLPSPLLESSEEEEVDVEGWTTEEELVPTSIPSVWPDPSSESETEIDILT
ncbi:BTB/POZ domain-containing protein 18-like [Otolemur garnettii]|uniref:BTB domain-containing protein n=1 Tax=Otolemur garnettii TaxID=30611 RepID=H0XX85_OTOGA|nr:BTB/POZ domain-containing protein 18-like [Otolemur garnettii]